MNAIFTKGTPVLMPEFDKSKVYLLQVLNADMHVVTDAVVPGDRIGQVIEEHKTLYPDFKRILIFDADTKDGVCVIRP